MFDIGFTEMLLVGLVALLAFGPERLPKVARETAFWVRKARRTLSTVKAEIEQEMELQDLKQSMQELKSARILEPSLEIKAAEPSQNPPQTIDSAPEPAQKTDG